jgi:predicted nucleic acid-binding protein
MVDTGAFIGLFNKNDEYHLSARTSFSIISEPLITTYPVVTETCYLLYSRLGHNYQINFLKSIAKKAFTVFDFQDNDMLRMIELMERYCDLPMDFADASMVVLAEKLGHGRILTSDRRDFNIYRWNNNQSFQKFLRLPKINVSEKIELIIKSLPLILKD